MSHILLLEPAEPEVLTAEDLPVLTVRLRLPCWQHPKGGRLNRYYRRWEAAFRRYCRSRLLPLAEAAVHRALETGGPLPQWEASLTSTVTWQSAEAVSLYTDMRLAVPGAPDAVRRGDTWCLRRGLPMTPGDFFPPRAHWRRRLLRYAAAQIRQAPEPEAYRRDWRRRLVTCFRPRRFYLTAEGLCFFYPAGTLLPRAPVTFCLPWDPKAGPVPPGQPVQE